MSDLIVDSHTSSHPPTTPQSSSLTLLPRQFPSLSHPPGSVVAEPLSRVLASQGKTTRASDGGRAVGVAARCTSIRTVPGQGPSKVSSYLLEVRSHRTSWFKKVLHLPVNAARPRADVVEASRRFSYGVGLVIKVQTKCVVRVSEVYKSTDILADLTGRVCYGYAAIVSTVSDTVFNSVDSWLVNFVLISLIFLFKPIFTHGVGYCVTKKINAKMCLQPARVCSYNNSHTHTQPGHSGFLSALVVK